MPTLTKGKIQQIGSAHDVVNDTSMSALYGIEVTVHTIGNRSVCIPGPVRFDVS